MCYYHLDYYPDCTGNNGQVGHYSTDGPKGECPFGRFQQTGQVCHAPWLKIVKVTRPRRICPDDRGDGSMYIELRN
jgi:hypothetical protein